MHTAGLYRLGSHLLLTGGGIRGDEPITESTAVLLCIRNEPPERIVRMLEPTLQDSVVPTEVGWLIARLFVLLGRLLSVNPLHLLGKDAPAGRHFFERSLY